MLDWTAMFSTEPAERLTVLLVEDNPDDVRLFERTLLAAGPGWRLETAVRLSQALNRLLDGGIDAVLLDLSLPDARGLEAVTTLAREVPHIPIVVLTGLDDESIGLRAVEIGAQDYLVKGQVTGPLVARALRYAIERKKTEQELRELNGALENAVSGIARLDGEGRYQRVNRAYARLLTQEPAALLGRPWLDSVLLEDRAVAAAAYHQVLVDGRAELEARLLREGQPWFYGAVVLIAAFDRQSRFAGHHCFIKDVTRRRQAAEDRERLVQHLQEALANVKTLRGLLPICSECKRIRDDSGYWNQIDSYIRTHSDARVSQGVCPDCSRRLHPAHWRRRDS